MEAVKMGHENDLNLKATELRLGLPGTTDDDNHDSQQIITSSVSASAKTNNKRVLSESVEESGSNCNITDTQKSDIQESAPAPKAQIVGWPPVRSCRKNNIQAKKTETETGIFVKVSMDGAPYLRKIDLKIYNGYAELFKGLENMFKLAIGEYSEREGYKGSEYAPAYEDKDGDLMLVGDVPWNMFISSCKRLRIMKGSDASGLGCAV